MNAPRKSQAIPVSIRPESESDHAAVAVIHRLAFGRQDEADLVAALRRVAHPQISLVATAGGRIVGHIFFSPVEIESETTSDRVLELGPMAVEPALQNRGVGSRLVQDGLEACRRAGHLVVFVLGHPAFYPRFGFVPAATKGMRCEFSVPDEVFMVVELGPGALAVRTGVVKYLPEFGTV